MELYASANDGSSECSNSNQEESATSEPIHTPHRTSTAAAEVHVVEVNISADESVKKSKNSASQAVLIQKQQDASDINAVEEFGNNEHEQSKSALEPIILQPDKSICIKVGTGNIFAKCTLVHSADSNGDRDALNNSSTPQFDSAERR